ncbi:serine/threonine protein kinase [Minicystis rosea]|nr:serine/threonine protein kinase [Minicystis rosea]
MTRSVRIGETIAGKYRVERVLGTGGMGVVVAARHVEMGWLRAVKIMHPDAGGRQGWAHRFRREAQVGRRLKSEHAVRVFDVGGFDDERPYIVMEHLEGKDLGKLLRTRGRMSIPDAVRHVSQACDAVAEAHDLGVVHRDLKPANLFVITGMDGAPCVKVLDFGISKSGLDEDSEALRLTQTGEVFGSPAYMAPEQIRSFHSADPRSDVWALGVILYELITGRWPFPGKASVEMIAMILEKTADPLSVHHEDVPPELEEVVLRCLEKDPARRMPSALALREALAPFLPAPEDDAPNASGEDDPTLVVPRSAMAALRASATACAAIPAPAPIAAPVAEAAPQLAAPDVAVIDVDVPPPSSGLQATASPLSGTALSGVQHTLPLAERTPAGPSNRVVLFVAAGAVAVVLIGLVALVRSAGTTAAKDGIADAGAGEGTAQAVADRASATAVAAVNAAAPEAPSDKPAAPAPDAPSAAPEAPSDKTAAPAAALEAPASGAAVEPAARASGKGSAGKATTDAPVGPGGRQLDQVAAMGALASAAIASKRCRKPGGPTGSSRVEVTFATSGRVSSVRLGGPFEGTPVGKCIRGIFQGLAIPSFEGSTFSAGKTVTIK